MTGRRCPACNGEGRFRLAARAPLPDSTDRWSSRKSPDFSRPEYWSCLRCGTLFSPVRTRSIELLESYASAEVIDDIEAELAAQTYERLCRRLLSSPMSIIDVGAGTARFLSRFPSTAYRTAVEPSRKAAEVGRQAGVHVVATLDLVEPASKFQLGSCFMTLEHLSDPELLVTQLIERLLPGGLLVVAVHNHDSAMNRLLGSRSPIMDTEHLQIFSRIGVLRLLERCGLEKVDSCTYLNRYPIDYMIRLAPLSLGGRERVATLVPKRIRRMLLPLPAGNVFAWGWRRG